jgi:acetylornithine deacetylase
VTVQGRPTHVLEATAGVDAIRAAWRLTEELRRMEAEMNAPEARPPAYADAVHPINVNVGRIQGGEWPSSVAASCTFEARVGFFPGATTAAELSARIEARLRAFAAKDDALAASPPRIEWVGFQAEPYEIGREVEPLPALAEAHASVFAAPPLTVASTATTDARILGQAGGIPTTCYGPRAHAIHGVDEWVDLDSVHEVTRVLTRFVASWCGLRRAPERPS